MPKIYHQSVSYHVFPVFKWIFFLILYEKKKEIQKKCEKYNFKTYTRQQKQKKKKHAFTCIVALLHNNKQIVTFRCYSGREIKKIQKTLLAISKKKSFL